MAIYIRSSGNVSPNSHPLLPGDAVNALRCSDPDLGGILDPKLTRRMSHVIKMGIAAAMQALSEANNIQPDAIITGSAYGCLEDTGIFLKKQVQQRESMLTPTSFIQSTHNTVGGQIGLMLHCNGYNNTFVHRGFSFEHALQDAIMLLKEKNAANVLVGAADEITQTSHALLSRFDLYKQPLPDKKGLSAKGTIAGEGAAFFLLSNQPSTDDLAILKGVSTFYKPNSRLFVIEQVQSFLGEHSLQPQDIDVIIAGKNGDAAQDSLYDDLMANVLPHSDWLTFKDQSGEYPTATAFALHKAAGLLKQQHKRVVADKPVKNILIYNHYQNIHHSLQLVAAC